MSTLDYSDNEKKAVFFFKLYTAFLVFLLFSNLLTYFRVLGIWNHVHTLILVTRLFDLAFCTLCIYALGKAFRFHPLYFLLFILPAYPFLLGVVYGNTLSTLANDVFLYVFLFIKILIFKILFDYEQVRLTFYRWIKKYTYLTIFVSFVMVCAAYTLSALGYTFYFQAPVDITYVMALASANWQLSIMLYLVVYSAFAGKRMILIGALTILFLSAFKKINRFFSFFVVAIVGVLALAVVSQFYDLSAVRGISKISHIITNMGDFLFNFVDTFKKVDPGRYLEIVSLWNSLDGIDYWVGKGFGYRYEYDLSLLNYAFENSESHSNSHFTPMGIISKFGFIGLFIWMFLYVYITLKAFILISASKYYYAAFLFLISILIQSFLAFGLFSNVFLPIVVGYILSKSNH